MRSYAFRLNRACAACADDRQGPLTQPSNIFDFRHDRRFWLCLALGPIAWAVLAAYSSHPIEFTFPPRLLRESPWRFVAVVAIYPLLEEIVFRGWLQPALAKHLHHRALPGISAANFVASSLFAAAHLIHQAPTQAFATFFPSLVFGHLRERFGSIVPCVLMHAFYNLGFFSLFGSR